MKHNQGVEDWDRSIRPALKRVMRLTAEGFALKCPGASDERCCQKWADESDRIEDVGRCSQVAWKQYVDPEWFVLRIFETAEELRSLLKFQDLLGSTDCAIRLGCLVQQFESRFWSEMDQYVSNFRRTEGEDRGRGTLSYNDYVRVLSVERFRASGMSLTEAQRSAADELGVAFITIRRAWDKAR